MWAFKSGGLHPQIRMREEELKISPSIFQIYGDGWWAYIAYKSIDKVHSLLKLKLLSQVTPKMVDQSQKIGLNHSSCKSSRSGADQQSIRGDLTGILIFRGVLPPTKFHPGQTPERVPNRQVELQTLKLFNYYHLYQLSKTYLNFLKFKIPLYS